MQPEAATSPQQSATNSIGKLIIGQQMMIAYARPSLHVVFYYIYIYKGNDELPWGCCITLKKIIVVN